MEKKLKIERREYSLLKPFIYLSLQIILIWEFFWVLTGQSNFTAWSMANLVISAFVIVYLFKKMLKIMVRTQKYHTWTDEIKKNTL